MSETRKHIPPYASLTFEEYWLEQDELWDISLKESKKQKEERIKKLNAKTESVPDVQSEVRHNEVAKSKIYCTEVCKPTWRPNRGGAVGRPKAKK